MIAPSIVTTLPPLILILNLVVPRHRGHVPFLVYHQVRGVLPPFNNFAELCQ